MTCASRLRNSLAVPVISTVSIQKISIILIVLVSLIKGTVWSVLIPPLYGYDEPMHFMYGRSIESTHSLRIKSSALIPLDIWEIDEPAEKRTILKDGVLARNLYHQDVERAVVTQPGFYTYHPPLYYCLVAGVETCLKHAGLVWEVLGCRLISVCLGVCTALLAYVAGRIFWKDEKSIAPLAMATIIIYQPMSAFSFAGISNTSLEITLFSALLVTCLQVIRAGFTRKLSLLIAVILVAGVLNKMSFIAAAPLVILLAFWRWRNKFGLQEDSAKSLSITLPLVALPSLLALYWWFQEGFHTGGDSLVHSFETQMHPKPFSLLRYVTTKPWTESYAKIVGNYFGHFGWKNAALPISILVPLAIGFAICLVICSVRAIRDLRAQDDFDARCRGFSVLFLTCATISLVLFYAAIDMRVYAVTGGGWFTIRGQYYMSAMIGQVLWVVSAIQWNRATLRSNFALSALCVGFALLNFYALFGVVTSHCYGACDFAELCSRVSLVQPFSSQVIAGGVILFVVATIGLLVFLLLASRNASSLQVGEGAAS